MNPASFPSLSGISRSADGVQSRQTLVDWRQQGEWRVRFGLVPISEGEVVAGPVVGVAVLDGGAKRLGKGDGRIAMEPVNRRSAPGQFRALHRTTEHLKSRGILSGVAGITLHGPMKFRGLDIDLKPG